VVDDTNDSRRDILARALADSVSQRYPDRFTAEQLDALCQATGPIVEIIATLQQYRLTNADEPDPIFRAYRGDG
jgi:hypothetical protein